MNTRPPFLRRFAQAVAMTAFTTVVAADFTGPETRSLCIELGVTPEVLTVLGMAADVGLALDRVAQSEVAAASFRQQQQNLAAAESALEAARAAARSTGEPSELARLGGEIAQREAEVVSASAGIDAARLTLLEALTEGVPPLDVQRMFSPDLAAVPPAYRLADLSPSQRSELLSALITEGRAIRRGEQVDQGTQQVLASYRSVPAVAAALAAESAHLESVRQAFFQWE